MALPLEKFVKQLEDSGILAGDTIKEFIPPKASPKDAVELARELVRQKKLTRFQVEEVSKGKGKSLVLGNYVLMEQIGAGGMGQVFKAEHRRMKRLVAIKLLPVAMTKDKASIARFEREVEAAAKISHPNIVAAHDADCANGVHFLVMELVEGSDLSALVRKNGAFPVEKAINCILQAARGLEAAHSEGVIHRDIKPANLLLDKRGTVKILDMGLARLNGNEDSATQAELTGTGTVMGTVDYMAPEQALSTKSADARADIYALGCSLYYLLTARATYDGETLMAKLLAHREQPIPSLRATCPNVPEPVEAVFQKMVAKRVADRFQSMTEVIVELEQCLAGPLTSLIIHPASSTTVEDTLFDFLKQPLEGPTRRMKTATHADAGKTGNGKRKLALVGGAFAGLAILASVIVLVTTRDGTLIVEVDQSDAVVQVLDAEGKVEISQKGGKEPISISVDPGKHRLKVEKDGFAVFGRDFEIQSGGRLPIRAKLAPLAEKPALAGTKAAPIAVPIVGTDKPMGPGKPVGPGKPLVEPEKRLFFLTPGFDPWVKDVVALPAEMQVAAVSKKLTELNPGFDGKVTGWRLRGDPRIENGAVVGFGFSTEKVADISPVRAFEKLTHLTMDGSDLEKGILVDLSPLAGTPVVELTINKTQVTDLSPLRGMQLTNFNCQSTDVSDLTPLAGMPLWALRCSGTKVADLSPLKGMPLREVQLELTPVSDLTPLTGMQITALSLDGTPVSNLSPLKNMPLTYLGIMGTQVADVSPIKDMPLKQVACDFKPFRDTERLRSIKSLELINSKPAADFWKEVEAQQGVFDQWTKNVAGMPAEEQVEAVTKKLVELNPGFDGKVTDGSGKAMPRIENGVVSELGFVTDAVTDISPVRALVGLKVLMCNGSQNHSGRLSDLSPLEGMKLENLGCFFTQVSDLSPLRRMPLKGLVIYYTNVSDVTPLEGLPLEHLDCSGLPLTSLMPLARCQQLRNLVVKQSKATFAEVAALQSAIPDCRIESDHPTKAMRSAKAVTNINDPAFQQWMKDVQSLPAEAQVEAVTRKLVELNPGFDGKITSEIYEGVVWNINLLTDNVTDISPVRALVGLNRLGCRGSSDRVPGKLADLAPLQGLPLVSLNIHFTRVADLAPLRGMKLTALFCADAKITDLSPLKGMPLAHLQIEGTPVSDLSPLTGLPLTSLQIDGTPVTDLSPLKGLPLTRFSFHRTLVSDLSPLQGTKLVSLGCYDNLVADLSPLKDMPLQELDLHFTPDRDTALLRSIKSLETINGKPAAEFYEAVEAYQAAAKRTLAFEAADFEQWVKETSALPAEEQVTTVARKLQELNPGFDGKLAGDWGADKPQIENGLVTGLGFLTDNVTDISPVRALVGLSALDLHGSAAGKGMLLNLSPLKGLPLVQLSVYGTRVFDLSPLQGMQLRYLHCNGTLVSDLSPLKEMKLEALDIGGTRVHDISALRGMPLTELRMNGTLVSDLAPLQGTKLTLLWLGLNNIELSPLKGMPLKDLNVFFKYERHSELLRSIKTLETINGKPVAEFWKDVEQE